MAACRETLELRDKVKQLEAERDQHWWAIRTHVDNHAGYLDHQQVCNICIYHRNITEKAEADNGTQH